MSGTWWQALSAFVEMLTFAPESGVGVCSNVAKEGFSKKKNMTKGDAPRD
jgi:hypothetical protein